MTKRYDWSKLPAGIVAMERGWVCEYISDGRYNYFPHTGAFSADAATPHDPDAAAEAYAKLRAAAKACEVTWRSEWQEATGMYLHDLCDGVTLSVDGIRISGHAGRKHRVTTYEPTASPASAVLRIAKIAEKLEALGWEAG